MWLGAQSGLHVHALRHTFGTLLSKGGIAPRTAQAAMRHSDIKLTMNVYTDPKLLDVRGALDALPSLPLRDDRTEGEVARATGTDDEAAREFAPGFVPTRYKLVQTESIADKRAGDGSKDQRPTGVDVSSIPDKGKGRLSSPDNRPSMSGRLDSNQRPPEPHSEWRIRKGLFSHGFSRIGVSNYSKDYNF
jgi:Phage integrase family